MCNFTSLLTNLIQVAQYSVATNIIIHVVTRKLFLQDFLESLEILGYFDEMLVVSSGLITNDSTDIITTIRYIQSVH